MGLDTAVGRFLLGRSVANADNYLLPIIVCIRVVSAAPSVITRVRENKDHIQAWRRRAL